jgi:hypothetical protein
MRAACAHFVWLTRGRVRLSRRVLCRGAAPPRTRGLVRRQASFDDDVEYCVDQYYDNLVTGVSNMLRQVTRAAGYGKVLAACSTTLRWLAVASRRLMKRQQPRAHAGMA